MFIAQHVKSGHKMGLTAHSRPHCTHLTARRTKSTCCFEGINRTVSLWSRHSGLAVNETEFLVTQHPWSRNARLRQPCCADVHDWHNAQTIWDSLSLDCDKLWRKPHHMSMLTALSYTVARALPDPKSPWPQNSVVDPKNKTLGVPWDSKKLDKFCPKPRTGSLMQAA